MTAPPIFVGSTAVGRFTVPTPAQGAGDLSLGAAVGGCASESTGTGRLTPQFGQVCTKLQYGTPVPVTPADQYTRKYRVLGSVDAIVNGVNLTSCTHPDGSAHAACDLSAFSVS